MTRSASYPDRETAQWATQQVVNANEQAVHRWLAQNSRRMARTWTASQGRALTSGPEAKDRSENFPGPRTSMRGLHDARIPRFKTRAPEGRPHSYAGIAVNSTTPDRPCPRP
nr:RNase A-like domain-containing protein [Streptomyces sp. SID4925]